MKTSECDAKLNNNDLEDQGESKHDVDVPPMIKKRKRKSCEFSDGSHQGPTYDANHESDEPNKKSRKKKKKKNKSKDSLEASIDNHLKTSECDAKLNNNDLEDQGESKHDVDVPPMIKKRKRKGCEFSDGSHQGLTYDANHESDEPNKKSRKKKNKSKDSLEASIDNHLALIPGVSHIKSHYLTLSKVITSDAGRDLFWDVAGRNLYRLSSDGACMLKSYIDKLMASHAKGYVHNCADGDDLAKNIGFHRNEFTRIKLLNKQKAVPGLLEDFKIKDFANLANLIDKARGPRGLGQFPEELANFVALLHDPIGKEHLILCHYALWSSKERRQYVAAFVRKLEMPRFDERCKTISKLDVKLAAFCNEKEFSTIFKGDRVMEEGFNRSLARTRMASKRKNELEDDDSDDPKDEKKKKNNRFYNNNFKELIRFIRNQTSDTTIDSEQVVYTAYRVEWKVFQYFPFYISWLCEYLIEEGLYSRMP